MDVFIIILIIVAIVFFVKRRKKANAEEQEKPFVPPEPGSKAEKKAQKEFKHALERASGEYGYAVIGQLLDGPIDTVIKAYALGNGVEKDPEKAKQWEERKIRAILQQKAFMNEIWGPSGYSAPNVDFFLDGKLVPPDLDKAEEMAWLLCETGTEGGPQELKKVLAAKYPDQTENINVQQMISDRPVVCLGLEARSKRIYSELCEEMKAAGVSELPAQIGWLLNKAGWNVPVNTVCFPGASAELEQQFKEARSIEAKGQDFKAAVKAYEPVAQAGHSEAMRRLGRILRDIVSKDECCSDYTTGVEWLTKAAQAGNALATFDLGGKAPDTAYIAGLAGQGNLDALYALGCMVEKGMGGKDNWGVAQAIFRTMEHQIGNAVDKKDGEGIEWLRKLGEKFWIKDDRYYIDLADAGSKIGYMPSRTELIYMSDEMMRRAYAQSRNRVGEGGDFGYCSYIINLAAEPSKAGIAKAARISRALREERSGFDCWSRKELEKAEQGKDSWSYAAGKGMPATERVSRQAASIQRDALIVYQTRLQKGANYYPIHSKILESDDFEATAAMFQSQLEKTQRQREAAVSTVEKSKCPYFITDENGRTWSLDGIVLGGVRYRMEAGQFTNPQYDLADSLGNTVIISDTQLASGSAKSNFHTFTW